MAKLKDASPATAGRLGGSERGCHSCHETTYDATSPRAETTTKALGPSLGGTDHGIFGRRRGFVDVSTEASLETDVAPWAPAVRT